MIFFMWVEMPLNDISLGKWAEVLIRAFFDNFTWLGMNRNILLISKCLSFAAIRDEWPPTAICDDFVFISQFDVMIDNSVLVNHRGY